jgi:hypothetical protein
MTDLLASLSDAHAALIAAIGKPLLATGRPPIWQYVESELDRQNFEPWDAQTTLPEIVDSRSGRRYGLLWYERNNVSDDTPLFLTVAGLYHLGTVESRAISITDDYVRVLTYLVSRRASAQLSPFDVTRIVVNNDEISREMPDLDGVLIRLLPDLLRHEPATMRSLLSIDPDGKNWHVELHRELLQYEGIRTTVDYVECASELLRPPAVQPEPAIPSPLELSATIDYFNVVWRLYIDKEPIVRLSGAERTARLVFEVTTADEFSTQVSAIAELLKNMRVSGRGKTALERLHNLMKENLPDDSQPRIERAMATLRDVASIRNGLFQHSGTEHRGVRALTDLGIAFPVTDWRSAWTIVQQRTIDALNALREEIHDSHEAQPDEDS